MIKRSSTFSVIILLICGSTALAGPPLVSPPCNESSPVAQRVTYVGGDRLGVSLKGITPQLAEYFGLSRPAGALVSRVEDDSPAAKAGLKAGDVIISVGGERVEDQYDAMRTLRRKPAGPLEIVVVRDKREMTLTAQLEKGASTWIVTPMPAVRLHPPFFTYRPIIKPSVRARAPRIAIPKKVRPPVKVKPARAKKGMVLL